jgi:hypothetical protein
MVVILVLRPKEYRLTVVCNRRLVVSGCSIIVNRGLVHQGESRMHFHFKNEHHNIFLKTT